jgi:DNA primase
VRLDLTLAGLAKRNYREQLRNLKAALDETSEAEDPIAFRALQTEYRRLLTQRPDTKTKTAS